MDTALNSLSPEQIRALERAVNGGAVPYNPPSVPSGNGLLRQSTSDALAQSANTKVPNAAPSLAQAQRLIEDLNNRKIPPTSTAPTPNTPIPPLTKVNNALTTGGNAIQRTLNTPIAFPAADKVNNALNKAGGAVAAASVAINVGGSIANAIRRPDANSLAQSAVSTASGALLLAPNPYAKAAGLALSVIGAPIVNLVFPSSNNVIPSRASVSPSDLANLQQSVGYVFTITSLDVRTGNSIQWGERGVDGAISGIETFDDHPTLGSGITITGSTGSVTVNGNSSFYRGFQIASVRRVDGQPINQISNPYQPLVNNDGRDNNPLNLPFDFDPNAIGDAIKRLEDLKDSVNGLSDQNLEILDQLKNLANTPNANPIQNVTIPPNAIPKPPIKPNEPKLGTPQSSSNETTKLPDNSKIMVTGVNVGKENDVSTPSVIDRLKEQMKQAQNATQTQAKPQTQTQQDRFKDPKDCQFSCENLAKCFVDLKVKIFDGCNPDTGVAKTKEITIQVLPKDKAKTEASFKELLDMRSRECDPSDRVQTTPEYWATRRGQIPQAIILYKTTTKGENGQPSYYQLQIPHYNGGKNGKPSLPTYQKGEHMAIYECIDGSQMQVYASSDAEALRVINACEKYINPRMRMKDKKNIKTGKRGGMEKVTVKPIRLDFSSTGQARKSAEWSMPL